MENRLLELLRLAIKYAASDIHIRRIYAETIIQLRIGNECRTVKSKFNDDKLVRYLQYLSGMDIGNASKGQSGAFEMEVDNQMLSLRFSYLATNSLIDGCIRILNRQLKIDINHLSSLKTQNDYFKDLINYEKGLIIFSGPTGSGKTTTLYTLLKSIKNKMIYTIEDPPEVLYDEFIQISVNEAIGLDYKEGIKQILRHDPDVIMIGEIRDSKAAFGAIEAANTGHLVLSSIHASSASNILKRLLGFGISENDLYDNLVCLSGQRLITGENNQKKVIYEIMDEKEILYFRKHQKNSPEFLGIDKQL